MRLRQIINKARDYAEDKANSLTDKAKKRVKLISYGMIPPAVGILIPLYARAFPDIPYDQFNNAKRPSFNENRLPATTPHFSEIMKYLESEDLDRPFQLAGYSTFGHKPPVGETETEANIAPDSQNLESVVKEQAPKPESSIKFAGIKITDDVLKQEVIKNVEAILRTKGKGYLRSGSRT